MKTYMGPHGDDRDERNDRRHNDNTTVLDRDPVTKKKPKTEKPSMYKVLLLNDDYTPMEYVVHLLQQYFHKNLDAATEIMFHVHKRGVGVAGVYTREIAETKVLDTMNDARAHGHPLQATIEKDE